MVSEDSQDLGWLPLIHGLSDLSDLDDARHHQVLTLINETNNLCELVEVFMLRSSQRVLLEEGDNYVPQVREPSHVIPAKIFPVIV